MQQKRIMLGLARALVIVFALLVLLRTTRVTGRGSRRDQIRSGESPQRKHPDGARSGSRTQGVTAVVRRFRPWRTIVGGSSFLAQRDASGEQEWMDLPGRDPRELAEMFKDLRRVNRWLGGRWMTVRALDRLIGGHDPAERITILDVASGSIDIPRTMSQWAGRRGREVSIVATDINPEVLKLAPGLGSLDSVQLVAADALRLPFADDAFDIAACSFFLHHLDPDQVVAALREMRRVSRDGVLINDMVRGWTSYLGAWTFSRAFTRNRISRHDAPLSARRSYTRAELIELASRAGLEPLTCYGFVGYRVALITRDRSAAPESLPQSVSLAPMPASYD